MTQESVSQPIVHLTTEAFEAYAIQNDSPILIDFWAPWCGPCRAYASQFEGAAKELAGQVRAAKVNIDDEPAIAEAFGVRSIPTTVLLRGNTVLDGMLGVIPSAKLVERVRAKLGSN